MADYTLNNLTNINSATPAGLQATDVLYIARPSPAGDFKATGSDIAASIETIAASSPKVSAAVNNINALRLPKWRQALGKVKAGTGNAKILCLGDSTTWGKCSTGPANLNITPLAYPTFLAKYLTTSGINSKADSALGVGKYTNAIDNRIVVGSGWTAGMGGGINGVLGGYGIFAGTTTSNLSFTPVSTVDTFEIHYYRGTSQGSFSWNVDGGANTVVNSNGADAYIILTVSAGALGPHTLNINYSSGGAVLICGFNAYNSAVKRIDVLNAGVDSWRTNDWIVTTAPGPAASPLTAIPTIAPDLTLINLTIVDAANGTGISTYQSQLQTIINRCLITGDVVMMTGTPYDVSLTAQATQQAYVDAFTAVAVANNLPLVDNFARFVSAVASAGFYADSPAIHLFGAGYSDTSQNVFNLLNRV